MFRIVIMSLKCISPNLCKSLLFFLVADDGDRSIAHKAAILLFAAVPFRRVIDSFF